MSDHDLPPLDDDVRALLQRGRGTEPPPHGVRARVLARVENVVASGPGGGGGGGGGGGTHAAKFGESAGWLRRLGPLVATFALGGAVGAAAMRLATPRPSTVVVQSPPRIVYVPAPASASPASVPSTAPAPASAARPPVGSASSSGIESSLAAERAILDRARGALENEDGAGALAATREHERRFPNGLLVQEREAMAIRALWMLGRRDEARARTDRFRARFPDSVLLPTLESQQAVTK